MRSGTPHRWVRGEGLGIPSPLLGCHLMRGARTPVSVVRRRGQGLHSRSPWLVLVCVLPYVTLPAQCALVCGYVSVGKDCACLSVVLVLVFTALRFGVRLSLYGQGLRLSLRGSGARVHCRARRCTNTAYGQGLRFLSVVLVLSASCARWYADTAYRQSCSFFSVSWCSCVCEHSRDPTVLVVIPVMAQMQIPMVRFTLRLSSCST